MNHLCQGAQYQCCVVVRPLVSGGDIDQNKEFFVSSKYAIQNKHCIHDPHALQFIEYSHNKPLQRCLGDSHSNDMPG